MKPYGISTDKLLAVREREAKRLDGMLGKSKALHERAKASQPCGVPMAWMMGLYEHLPMFVESAGGSWFTDVDDNRYLDMNQADVASFMGYGSHVITQALADRASRGGSFLLPTEDGIVVTEMLAERSGLPFWQFTASASQSNMEVIRMARVATGREAIVMFEGKYHGHIDDTMVIELEGESVHEGRGLAKGSLQHARIIPFNDLAALERVLAPGDVACVIAEPALTNCNVVYPDDEFWATAREMTHAAGALLVMDEAHTGSFAYGGLTNLWSINPDVQVVGKGMGSSFPFSAYGMTRELADLCERYLDRDRAGQAGLMIGGTTHASALGLSVARAALETCLTRDAHVNMDAMGKMLGEGLETLFAARNLDWRAPNIGGRSGWYLKAQLPRTAKESGYSLDTDFTAAKRLFMATHGVWEAISSAGPAAMLSHTAADIGVYLEKADEFLDEVC
jgi:glutamate-1-semialdehyde 2,1-aminomutase